MRNLLLFISLTILLFSCQDDGNKNKIAKKNAKGPVEYGGVFRVNEVEDFRNLFPLNVTEVSSFRITNQIYEGLVKFHSADLSIVPGIAESWDISDDATVFTFNLRKGVKFHDDPCFPGGKGREVTAHDFKYCITRLCSADPDNQLFWVVENKIKGANAYHASTVAGKPLEEGVEGVKVIDDYTLQIELEYPAGGFLNILGHSGCWVYPKEAWEEYGSDMRIKCVGTGPYRVKTIKEGEAVILERNLNYWKKDQYGNQLPYMDAIRFSFLKEKKSELLEFKKGNLDMVFRLPLEMIDDVVGELEDAKKGGNTPFQMQVTPALLVQYYGFQHKSEIFSKKEVRQAFNYAIDRHALVTYTLQGEGRPGIYGVVPPGFRGYGYDSLKGYDFNPELAKDLMAQAGYPKGNGFPEITLQLNSGGSRNTQLAEAIQNMLIENLGIQVKLEVMPMAQHLESVETGKTVFFRTGWLADYPDPEAFLNLLFGPHVPEDLATRSYVNSIRYQNEEFDQLFMQALNTVDKQKRYELYRKADQVALSDAAYMPICYDEFTRLLQTNVKNFPANSLEYRDFSEVFFKN